MEPAMMIVDVIASIINQNTIISIFERLKGVDEKLAKENIDVSFEQVIKLGKVLCGIVVCSELILTTLNLVIFSNELTVASLYYYFTGLPLILNSFAKIWFICLIVVVRQRFKAINKYLNATSKLFGTQKKKYDDEIDEMLPEDAPNYLEKDMAFFKNKQFQANITQKIKPSLTKVKPYQAYGEQILIELKIS